MGLETSICNIKFNLFLTVNALTEKYVKYNIVV